VTTPTLVHAGVTDPHIHSLATHLDEVTTRYLHTSPELAMKRLLAAGVGDIYQICSVFRAEERGRLHHAEFLLCEWYRVGLDHHALMQEMDTLFRLLWEKLAVDSAGQPKPLARSQFVTYASVIESVCQEPLISLNQQKLCAVLLRHGIESSLLESDSLDAWLDLLMSCVVCPQFPSDRFTFLYDYPASQAALARTGLNAQGDSIAHRFEVFFGAVELANGFHELTDAAEQRARFEQDNIQRELNGLPKMPIDSAFLAALEAGLPECAGVAVGLERLLMVMLGAEKIADVLPLGSDYAH